MAVMSLLLLLVAPSAVLATPCSGLYGAEALTCAWEQDVKTCMETSCHGCSGEPCQLCREDTENIHDCCQKHYHSASPPLMCESAAITEGVKACVQAECQGCSGEQCQLCQEDSTRISACCTQHDVSDPPQICRDAMKGPCDGLQGDALGRCQWEQEVTACLDNKCAGCSGEQCQLCRESSESILSCCNDSEQDASQPEMCKTAFETTVTKCVEDQCRKCSGEQCQLCREDAERYTECCKQHGVSTKVCEAAQTQGRQHRREILP